MVDLGRFWSFYAVVEKLRIGCVDCADERGGTHRGRRKWRSESTQPFGWANEGGIMNKFSETIYSLVKIIIW